MGENDIACRYGGEEFLLILPNTTPAKTHQIAEQLCCDVRSLTVSYYEQQLDSVTISVGVALFPYHGIIPEKVIDRADEALYRAKNRGRNQVVTTPILEPIT
jgi:diguanylate cyclase (GGDEF)-like protein